MSIWDAKTTLYTLGGSKDTRKRSVRVAEAVRNELSIVLVQQARDPKIKNVTLTRVIVSDDLKFAKIYYTVIGGKKAGKQAGEGLERAKGFMRSHIAKALNLRYTPALHFYYDETAEKVEEVEELFREIARERSENEGS